MLVSWIALDEHTPMRDSSHSGEETPPTSSDTSLPRLSTSPSRTTSSHFSATRRREMDTVYGSSVTWLPVVPLVPLHFSSSTLWIMPVPVSLTTTSPQRRVAVNVNSMDYSMSTRRPSLPMVLPVSTVVSFPQSLVSLSTVVYTSACTTP